MTGWRFDEMTRWRDKDASTEHNQNRDTIVKAFSRTQDIDKDGRSNEEEGKRSRRRRRTRGKRNSDDKKVQQ